MFIPDSIKLVYDETGFNVIDAESGQPLEANTITLDLKSGLRRGIAAYITFENKANGQLISTTYAGDNLQLASDKSVALTTLSRAG